MPGTLEEKVRYEHGLLSQLGETGLPFAVPVPVATAEGEPVGAALVVGDERRSARAYEEGSTKNQRSPL